MSILIVRGISKTFGSVPVLSNIDLDIDEGEIVSLLGPSGCGKSTLLRIIAGLESADSGAIEIGGREITRLDPGARNIAMVFQNLALYPHLTGRQNIALPLRVRRMSRWQRIFSPLRLSAAVRAIERDIEATVDELAARLAIAEAIERLPGRLSGGQRQRVAIGRALVRDSRLLLLDEPLSSLDAKLRIQARDEILQIQRSFGVSCVFVTHDQDEALAISDRVAVILGGRIAQFDTPAAIYRTPSSLNVARFVGTPTINCLEGIVEQPGRVRVGGHLFDARLAQPAGSAVTVAIRPEHVRVGAGHDRPGTSLRVVRVEDHGHDGLVHLAADDQAGVSFVARTGQPVVLRPGDEVRVAIEAHDALFFGASGTRLESAPVRMADYAHG